MVSKAPARPTAALPSIQTWALTRSGEMPTSAATWRSSATACRAWPQRVRYTSTNSAATTTSAIRPVTTCGRPSEMPATETLPDTSVSGRLR
ncbi:hypothetical protein D9M69_679210 [compost metagenome]